MKKFCPEDCPNETGQYEPCCCDPKLTESNPTELLCSKHATRCISCQHVVCCDCEETCVECGEIVCKICGLQLISVLAENAQDAFDWGPLVYCPKHYDMESERLTFDLRFRDRVITDLGIPVAEETPRADAKGYLWVQTDDGQWTLVDYQSAVADYDSALIILLVELLWHPLTAPSKLWAHVHAMCQLIVDVLEMEAEEDSGGWDCPVRVRTEKCYQRFLKNRERQFKQSAVRRKALYNRRKLNLMTLHLTNLPLKQRLRSRY